MGAIAEIFREFAPEYLRRVGDAMPPEHRKVIDAILLCRTEENGSVVYRCEECGLNHILNRSCGNRHCPQCQSHKTTQWLERQMERMLPGHHFMLTFTVPEELRDFIRSHQRLCYAALFAASSAAMKKLCLDPRHVGGAICRASSASCTPGAGSASTIPTSTMWSPAERSPRPTAAGGAAASIFSCR